MLPTNKPVLPIGPLGNNFSKCQNNTIFILTNWFEIFVGEMAPILLVELCYLESAINWKHDISITEENITAVLHGYMS